jgi:hypothetical protein
MEHFGTDLQGPCSMGLVQWIESNRILVCPLSDTLSAVPCPYPHLARAVVRVTPINSQAVTIAAKQGMADWLERELSRLASVRPEGYENWRYLTDHLLSQGGLSEKCQITLTALSILSDELHAERAPAVSKAMQEASVNIYLRRTAASDVQVVCSELEKLGDDVAQYSSDIASWLLRLPDDALTALAFELCDNNRYPCLAHIVVEHCTFLRGRVSIAVHYGWNDRIRSFIDRDPHGVAKYLYTRDAAEARAVIALLETPKSSEFFHLAVHHRMSDDLSKFLNSQMCLYYINVDLCKRDALYARTVIDMCDGDTKLLPAAAHHSFTDVIIAMAEKNLGDFKIAMNSLRSRQARTVIELFPFRNEFFGICARHRFHDLMSGYIQRDLTGVEEFLGRYPFPGDILRSCTPDHWQIVPFMVRNDICDELSEIITRDADGRFIAPAYTPTSPHRLAVDDAVNAWLWLIKGDGDVTERVWRAMKAAKLIVYETAVAVMVRGVYESGRKVSSAILTAGGGFVDIHEVVLILDDIVSTSNTAVVKGLIEDGIIKMDRVSWLLFRVRDVSTAQLLVDSKADVSVRHRYSEIFQCPQNRMRDCLETPLHHADNVDIARCFVENGAEVDAVSCVGESPLHTAQNVDVARFLLEHKADVHRRSNFGDSPLDMANDVDMLQLLIEHNADVNATRYGGDTRLHREKDPAIIRCLINNGADAGKQNEEGCTALHTAVEDASAVQCLLESVASLSTFSAAD